MRKNRHVVVARIDPLESRCLLSASAVTAALANGVLTVTGTDNGDVIKLAVNGSNINVKSSGVLVQAFAKSQVTSVVITDGSGNDSITVNAGVPAANISGGAGADTIVTANGHDTLGGGQGLDNLTATAGHNQLNGGKGGDNLAAKGKDNFLGGGAGDDILTDLNSSAGDTINGGAGNNSVQGSDGTDSITNVQESLTEVDTFDLSSTSPVASNEVTFTPASSFNYDPTVPNVRYDYGGAGGNAGAFLSSNNSTLGNPLQVSPSGSVALSGNFNESTDSGNNKFAYTFDLFPSAATYNYLSFDIMVDPASAADSQNGNGYFQVFARDQNYGSENVTGGNLAGGIELGVSYSPVTQTGKWFHITATLDSADFTDSVRALTFQDYGDSSQNITGNETIYIDNLTLGQPMGS